MQWLCCLLFISKTFWHSPRKSSSQLRQGTFFQFYFVIKYSITETHGWYHGWGVNGGDWWLHAEAGEETGPVTQRQRDVGLSPSLASPWGSCCFGTWLELTQLRGPQNLGRNHPEELRTQPMRSSSCCRKAGENLPPPPSLPRTPQWGRGWAVLSSQQVSLWNY